MFHVKHVSLHHSYLPKAPQRRQMATALRSRRTICRHLPAFHAYVSRETSQPDSIYLPYLKAQCTRLSAQPTLLPYFLVDRRKSRVSNTLTFVSRETTLRSSSLAPIYGRDDWRALAEQTLSQGSRRSPIYGQTAFSLHHRHMFHVKHKR